MCLEDVYSGISDVSMLKFKISGVETDKAGQEGVGLTTIKNVLTWKTAMSLREVQKQEPMSTFFVTRHKKSVYCE